MMNLSIRKFTVKDIDDVINVYKESFDVAISSFIDYNNENIYLVCMNDEIVGMCMVDYINHVFISKKVAFINDVCVCSKYRGCGIAKFMLKEVEKILKEDGVAEIMLTSSPKRVAANNLYKNLGFSIYETNVYKKKI